MASDSKQVDTRSDRINNLLIINDGRLTNPTKLSEGFRGFIEHLTNTAYFLWDPEYTLESYESTEQQRTSELVKINKDLSNKLINDLSIILGGNGINYTFDPKIEIKDANILIGKSILDLNIIMSHNPLIDYDAKIKHKRSPYVQFREILFNCKVISKIVTRNTETSGYDELDCITLAAAALCYYEMGDYQTVTLIWNGMPTIISKPQYLDIANRGTDNIDLYPMTFISKIDKTTPITIEQPKDAKSAIGTLDKLITHTRLI